MQGYQIFLWNSFCLCMYFCLYTSMSACECDCVHVCYSRGEERQILRLRVSEEASQADCSIYYRSQNFGRTSFKDASLILFLEWPAKEQNINKSLWLEEGGMFSNFKNIICPRNSFFFWTPSLSVLPKAKSFAKMIFYQCWRWCWRVSGWFVWVLVIHWGDHLFVPLTLDSN